MKEIRLEDLNLVLKNKQRVVGLGLFESMHQGHVNVVRECVRLSDKYGIRSSIITFSKAVNKTGYPIFDLNHRLEIIDNLGVDEVFVVEMSENVINTDKQKFIDFLTNIGTKIVVCGDDFHFGAGGVGTVVDLQAKFKVEIVPLLEFDGVKISTSNIRSQLIAGNIKHVNQLLGYNYFITGNVEKGKQLGRTIGFPTANIYPNSITLARGVYLSKVILDGNIYPSITNVGVNPTVGGERLSVETFIGNGFDQEIYGRLIKVELIEKIRDEEKFASIELLTEQLNRDILKMEELWN